MESKTATARALAAEGFKVFPIAAGAKHPPLLNGWPQKATTDESMIDLFWMPLPDANIGIHCEGLLVIDVDVKKGGEDSLELLKLTDDLPATRRANTASGGHHLYYRLEPGHRGVPNTVSVLGTGLDVRSTGGYVVAPGSVVAAGAYAWADPSVPVAMAPAWLVDRLGVARERSTEDDADRRVPDAATAVVERARDWLRTAPRSVEGQGGDQTAYFVACSLRDMGVSQAQALDLLVDWNETCLPPWDGESLILKVANAYRYAENEAGSRAALPEDFPVVETSTQEFAVSERKNLVRARSAVRSLAELAGDDRPPPGYVVKGLLDRGSYAVLYGAPGEGKTFVALDVAYHVAAGRAWMAKKVRAAPVLYLAYEGQGGLAKRAKALQQRYGKVEVPLHFVDATFNLRELAGRQALGAIVGTIAPKPGLIVVDTFARALMGGDENSAQDVGAFNSAIAALIESTGACVMLIHHTGKDKSKGARGSSALLGAIDTEIMIDGGQIRAEKQRDQELGEPIGFKLTPLLVGMDEDGDGVTSCVVEAAAVGAQGLERVSGNAKRGLAILCEMAPNNRPVDPLEWRDRCAEFLGGKNVAQRFYDVKKILAERGYIDVNEKGYVTRRMT